MITKETLIDKIANTQMCYEASKTEENNTFVDGVIYGMEIAMAVIKGEKEWES